MIQTIALDPLSLSSIYIEPMFGDNRLGIATGFIWEYEKANFLVTNWHVITGFHPETDQPSSVNGSTPDVLRIWLQNFEIPIKWESYNVKLFDKQNRPLWKEHKTFRESVDIAIIRLDLRGKFQTFPINSILFDEFSEEISQDVFIIGFPKGITGKGRLPIWKRGSIASEPDADLDDVPKLLIDSATQEGMSGSPVVVQSFGFHKKDQEDPDPLGFLGNGRKLLGIYSGRLPNQDTLAAQLGLVWKAHLIEEIIISGVRPD